MRGLEVLAGNPQAKHRLSAGRGLSHAYILSGPAGSGKHTLAGLLARALVCSGKGEAPCGACPDCRKAAAGIHPDVITIGEEGKDINVAMVRALRSDAYIRPNEAPRKVYLLPNAHTMNQSAQNAMLKLLEEGPAYAVFLLLAENGGGLLQTVRSRCEELDLVPVPPAEAERWLSVRFPDQDPAAVRRAALECQGLLGRGVELLEGGGEAAETRRQQADQLVTALDGRDELALLEASMLFQAF